MKRYLLSILSVALFTLMGSTDLFAQAQVNLALSAVSTHSGGGVTIYGPDNYNDGNISNCGSTPWGWVSTNGWIQYEWTSPQIVGKVIFYKDNRPMTQCVIEYWDGSSFQTIMNYNSTQTCLDSVSFPTVTTTRLRFNSVAGSSNPNHREIEVYSGIIPCTGIPTTYIEGPTQACKNRPFILTLNGLQITSGLTFKWEYSNNGQVWSNFVGTPTPIGGAITDSITATKWYRCLVTCNSSGQSYQTPAFKVDVAPFYYCYCLTENTTDKGIDIGNMTLVNTQSGDTVYNVGSVTKLTSNDAANRTYTDYMYEAPQCLYRDTTYELSVLQFTSDASFKGGYLTAYLDINRDGVYDTATERVVVEKVTGINTPPEWTKATFKIPSNAQIGLTGFRVILSDNPALLPCDEQSGEGEVEDYVVEICHRPCDGPTNAGLAISTDNSMCLSYDYTVMDTSYEQARSGFVWTWQVSGDNLNWFGVNNSSQKDTLRRTFTGQPLYYRIRMICPNTDDTTYSQTTFVNAKPGYKCYCYSKATGGGNVLNDTSDIGGIVIGSYSQNDGGAHVKNVNATRPRTDHTDDDPLVFYTDSIYAFHVFHTLNTVEHGDAKITVFVDFNNNHQYDIPEERIYTGFTSVGNHTLIDNMLIPHNVITDVPTGMRFILNNEVGPNVASDEGCGGYVSGETEDFMVVFRRKFPTGVNAVGTIENFSIYPNPTSGKFNVRLDGISTSRESDIRIQVTTITGKQILSETDTHRGGTYNKVLDMGGYSAGVYFVKVSVDGKEMIRKLIVE